MASIDEFRDWWKRFRVHAAILPRGVEEGAASAEFYRVLSRYSVAALNAGLDRWRHARKDDRWPRAEAIEEQCRIAARRVDGEFEDIPALEQRLLAMSDAEFAAWQAKHGYTQIARDRDSSWRWERLSRGRRNSPLPSKPGEAA